MNVLIPMGLILLGAVVLGYALRKLMDRSADFEAMEEADEELIKEALKEKTNNNIAITD